MDDFTEFLRQYGASHPPSMLFDGREGFSTWRDRFFAKVHELLEPWPERLGAPCLQNNGRR